MSLHDRGENSRENKEDSNNNQEENEKNRTIWEDFVLSEIHVSPGNGIVDGQSRISLFQLHLNNLSTGAKEEEVQESQRREKILSIEIQHAMGTPLSRVGEQVWTGAFLMADFVVHYAGRFDETSVLELGSGTGFVGILVALVTQADTVFCTDIDISHGAILDNCAFNIQANANKAIDLGIDHVSVRDIRNVVKVRALDWGMGKALPILSGKEDIIKSLYSWNSLDIDHFRTNVSVIIAADVIYDNCATDQFVELACLLLQEKITNGAHREMFLAMEKRINFSLEAGNVDAKAYDYLFQRIRDHNRDHPHAQLILQQMNLEELPQYFDYDRTPQLELWNLTCAI